MALAALIANPQQNSALPSYLNATDDSYRSEPFTNRLPICKGVRRLQRINLPTDIDDSDTESVHHSTQYQRRLPSSNDDYLMQEVYS